MKKIYIVAITLIGICLVPVLAVITVFIAFTSGFPVIFRQVRVGKNGELFTIYKFRTMIRSADKKKRQLMKQNESDGPVFKIRNDPRFTRIGAFLSHTGLDELPQIINVLRGEMALIGPRPLPVSEAKKLKAWMKVREQILPGIISPAILTGKYHENFNSWMRSDVMYVQKKNAIGDVRLFLQSFSFLAKLFVRSVGLSPNT